MEARGKVGLEREVLHTCAFNGAFSCVSQISDALTIIHGPRSCAHIVGAGLDYYRLMSYKRSGVAIDEVRPRALCTEMDEMASIFGGKRYLQLMLEKSAGEGWPLIFIITTCASGIIGDDVQAIADNISWHYPGVIIKAITTDGNMQGDFEIGRLMAMRSVLDLIDRPVPQERGSVNIIDESDFFVYNRETNFRTISELLDKLGMKVNCRFLTHTNLESIKAFGRAEFCLSAQSGNGHEVVRAMIEKETGVPFFHLPLPAGFDEVVYWLSELGAYTGQQARASETIKELEKRYRDVIQTHRTTLEGKRVLAYVHSERDGNWINGLSKDLGIHLVRTGIYGQGDKLPNEHSHVNKKLYSIQELRSDVSDLNPDLILTDSRIPTDIPCRQYHFNRPDASLESTIAVIKILRT